MSLFTSLYLLVATAVAAQSPLLPESVTVVALGHDSKTVPLQAFADRLKTGLHRPVVTYREFESVHFTSEKGSWWNRLSYDETTAIVEQAIRKAVARYPDSKVIAFNLDGYNPGELFDSKGEVVRSYTNFEVCLLLGDHQLFAATRWYRGGTELEVQEAERFWSPTLKRLRAKRCLTQASELLK